MKKLIKTLFVFTLIVSFSVALFGCNFLHKEEYIIEDEYSTKSEEFKRNLDKIISSRIVEYSESYGLLGDVLFESHKVYGMETNEDNLYIYITSFISGFSFVGDKIETKSSYCSPARLILSSDDYKFVNYREPTQGIDFDEAIKEVFPEKYCKMALKYSEDHHRLLTENRNKLTELLKKQGKDKYYLADWLDKKSMINDYSIVN